MMSVELVIAGLGSLVALVALGIAGMALRRARDAEQAAWYAVGRARMAGVSAPGSRPRRPEPAPSPPRGVAPEAEPTVVLAPDDATVVLAGLGLG